MRIGELRGRGVVLAADTERMLARHCHPSIFLGLKGLCFESELIGLHRLVCCMLGPQLVGYFVR